MTTEFFRSLLKGKVMSFSAYFYYAQLNCHYHRRGKTLAVTASPLLETNYPQDTPTLEELSTEIKGNIFLGN